MGVPDKCLLKVGRQTALQHIVETLRPQVGSILINSNSDPRIFEQYHLPVRADVLSGRLGPLAGLHTAMKWAKEMGSDFVATVPGDTPFLPADLIQRMKQIAQYGRPIILSTGDRIHPTIGLWPVALVDRLYETVMSHVTRMRDWCRATGAIEFLYLSADSYYFLNLNTTADLEYARTKEAFSG
jgi:molybdopterin-guanine dinucleotide biosynthesis protein A